MLIMTILAIISRTTPYKTWWPIVRIVVNFCLAIGTALVSVLWYHEDAMEDYLYSPWVIPAITLVWTVILILTHINGEGISRIAKGPQEIGLEDKA